jgi:hypothetical protein
MARPLSDDSIEHRVCVAYLRLQGLARNTIYREEIRRLQDGWEEDGARVSGLHFDAKGYLASPPSGWQLALVDEICQRSGLILPWLPQRLKEISLDDMRVWHDRPMFDDVPGWTLEPKARRRRSRRGVASNKLTQQRSAQSISDDFVPLDEEAVPGIMDEALRKALAEMEAEIRGGRTSASTNPSAETLDLATFKHVAVLLRQVGERHHALEDGNSECWTVFDWHQEGVSDTDIAKRLWPQLHPTDIRHRVHQRLQTARRIIDMAYAAEPIRREKRRKRRLAPTQ